ncbi:MAG: hypothetical protein ABJD07_01370 [Gemmatimonadaceae bacterium]
MTWPVARQLLAFGLLLGGAPVSTGSAQSAIGMREARGGVVFETWHLGPGTLEQIDRVQQTSIPVAAGVRFGALNVDLYGAYAQAMVRYRNGTEVKLDGLTDVKLRGTFRLPGDNWMLTAGVTVPTGKTKLSEQELDAVRVLGAPALRFQTPAYGTGAGGLAGIVYSTRVGSWGWGFGASFEKRGSFEPVEAAALGYSALDLSPSSSVRLTAGTDGIVGQTAMSVNVSSTLYGTDKLYRAVAGVGSVTEKINLGPAFSAEWRWRVPAAAFNEITVFAYDRYRTKYKRGEPQSTVPGTSSNELEGGAFGSIPITPSLGVVMGLNGRYHSGLSVDNLISTAAIASGGGRIGLSYAVGDVMLQPALGGEIGSMNTGGHSLSVNKLLLSFSIGTR